MFVKQDLWLACHQRLDDVIAAAKAQLPKWLAPIQHPSKAILKDENRQNYCTVLYISVISLLAVMITLMKVMIARPTFLELNHVTKWVARAQQKHHNQTTWQLSFSLAKAMHILSANLIVLYHSVYYQPDHCRANHSKRFTMCMKKHIVCITLHCIALQYVTLRYITLNHIVLYGIKSYCIIWYQIILYYMISKQSILKHMTYYIKL